MVQLQALRYLNEILIVWQEEKVLSLVPIA